MRKQSLMMRPKRIFLFFVLLLWMKPGMELSADISGSRDYPSFQRVSGYQITEYSDDPDGSHSFADARGEDVIVKGRKVVIRYEIGKEAQEPKKAEILRRHAEVARNANGSTYEYTGNTLFLSFIRNGKETWAEVYVGDEYYTLTIIEKPAALIATQEAKPNPSTSKSIPPVQSKEKPVSTTDVPIPQTKDPAPLITGSSPPKKPLEVSERSDLSISQLSYSTEEKKLSFRVSNHTGRFSGPIEIHLSVREDSRDLPIIQEFEGNIPEGNSLFKYDQTELFQVALSQDESKILSFTRFHWPAPATDYPRLFFSLRLDPQNHLTETDKGNNSLEKAVALLPQQGAQIQLERFVDKQGGVLFGRFGAPKPAKRLFIEKDGIRHAFPKVYVISQGGWRGEYISDENGTRVIPPPGTYNLYISWSEPENDIARSNFVPYKLERKEHERHILPFSTDELNPDAFADVLDEELLGPMLDSPKWPPDLDLWVSRVKNSSQIAFYCAYRYTHEKAKTISYSIIRGGVVQYGIVTDARSSKQGSNRYRWYHQRIFPALSPGTYQFICTVELADGRKKSASHLFEVIR